MENRGGIIKMELETPTWISPRFTVNTGGLHLSGIPLGVIAQDVGTPFYAYDSSVIMDQFRALFNALSPHNVEIFYSMKANPSLAVVNLLNNLGSGVEIASIGELAVVRRLGIPSESVSFAGPVKTEEAVREAIDYGIYAFNAESEYELGRISREAYTQGKVVRVGLRVNPDTQVVGSSIMAGRPTQFGIDIGQIDKPFIDRIQALQNISLEGVHIFAASGIMDVNGFLANINNTLQVAEYLNQFYPVRYLDLGGGLGIPYNREQPKLPLDLISGQLGKLLAKYHFLGANETRVYVEPGRFLVGPSGIYVAEVDYIKKSREENFVMINGGIHHMLRPALISSHPTYNLSRLEEVADMEASVAGVLCTPKDLPAPRIKLPSATRSGDLIGICNAGAYGYTESMPWFLSHPTAPEVMVRGGKYQIIRYRVDPEAFLYYQNL